MKELTQKLKRRGSNKVSSSKHKKAKGKPKSKAASPTKISAAAPITPPVEPQPVLKPQMTEEKSVYTSEEN